MGLRYENLDQETRALMIAEIEHDLGLSGAISVTIFPSKGNEIGPTCLRTPPSFTTTIGWRLN